MMNYVAIQLTSYFVALWENPVGSNTVGVINQRTKDGWFPELFGQEYGLNVVLVLLLTVGMFLYLKYSKQGDMRSPWWATARTPPGTPAST